MTRSMRSFCVVLCSAVFALPVVAQGYAGGGNDNRAMMPLATNRYMSTPLTTNGSGGMFADKNLVNPWGLARSSGGPWWVSDNGTGLSTLYSGTGSVIPLVVTVPAAKQGSGTMGSPTGIVFNGGPGFTIGSGSPAFFLFVTEDGTISGWNSGTSAMIAVNESKQGASFKGATMATANLPGNSGETLMYVADFTLGKVEVFDGSFRHVAMVEEAFNGEEDDDDSAGNFHPFNVQNLGGNIYVTYAKLGSGNNELDGPGLGRVKVFSPEGRMLMKLQKGEWFNAPWGLAVAPSDFGPYSHSILVGNFGNGWIAAFNPVTGEFQDYLRNTAGGLVTIPGLWGLAPGNDGKSGNATSLYYSAGGSRETSGVLGTLTATMNPQGNDQ